MVRRSALEEAVRGDLEAHPPVMDAGVREGIALAAHDRAALLARFPSATLLAAGLQVVLLWHRATLGGQAFLGADVVSVRPRRKDPEEEALAIFHELAELLLDREGRHYSHGDVWLLALALAIPRDRVHLVLFYRQKIPPWAVAIRLETTRAIARVAWDIEDLTARDESHRRRFQR